MSRTNLIGSIVKIANEVEKQNRREMRLQLQQEKAKIKAKEICLKQLSKETREKEKAEIEAYKELRKEKADDENWSIEEFNKEINRLLMNNDHKDFLFDWNMLKDHSRFSGNKIKEPTYINNPPNPDYKTYPQKPNINNKKYQYKVNLFQQLFGYDKSELEKKKYAQYNYDLIEWKKEVKKIEINNKTIEEEYNKQYDIIKRKNEIVKDNYHSQLKKYEEEKHLFLEKQKIYNNDIEKTKEEYNNNKPEAIIKYYNYIIEIIEFPEYSYGLDEPEIDIEFQITKDYKLFYNNINNMLIIDFEFPSIEQIPNIKKINYIKLKDEYHIQFLSKTDINNRYEKIIYSFTLYILYNLFKHDINNLIKSIVFNGYVKTLDKATGHEISPFILSIQTEKDDFNQIDLSNVDPKECFKKFKGVSCAQLHTNTPIPPILKLNKEDKRFIDSVPIAYSINEYDNIALMHWKDFEYLIRELFEMEFSQNGGEVKVTQSSRDGGVDAIAFDPDPIRGGKIIIQAKRYTNTVGVSAVRDLFGTIMNEGATKGILITTSDYGHDAYKFAKDKPITLLNGGHLLGLLEKHGHKAIIDLEEAKKEINEMNR